MTKLGTVQSNLADIMAFKMRFNLMHCCIVTNANPRVSPRQIIEIFIEKVSKVRQLLLF